MSKRPNVVLFISDQQRADTLPGASPVEVHAPHAAWLSQQGATFRNAMCTSPLCTPARASILTGQYPHTSGIVANYDLNPLTLRMREDTKVLADLLKPAGYTCAYVGKWHLPTASDRRGFSDFVRRMGKHDIETEADDDGVGFARKTGMGDDIDPGYASYLIPKTGEPGPATGRSTKLPLAFHGSSAMVQEAAAFIRSQADEEAPFCLVFSCIEPHALGMRYTITPAPFDRMYDGRDMPLPATRRDETSPFIARKRNTPGLKSTDRFTDDELGDLMAGYYGAVSYVDHLIGLLLEPLIATDQLDDTLVIFTSDHGEMLGDHRMLKKGPVMYEGLVNVPLVVKAPGQRDAGHEVERVVSHVDLVPTVLEQCGVEVPADLPGKPLQGLMHGGDEPVHDGVTIEYHSRHYGERLIPLRAWRTEEWKYVETVGGDDELYDSRNDPDEMENLARSPEHDDVKARLRDALYADMAATDDAWPEVVQPDHEKELGYGVWEDLARTLERKRDS